MRPYLILAIVLAFAASNAVTAYRAYHTGVGFAEARIAKEVAKAQAEAAVRQKALVNSIQQVAEEAFNEQVAMESRLADTDSAVELLRAAIRSANTRASTAATAVADGETARALLAECASQYRNVAREADKLRSIVIGLQGYARAVSN